MIQIPLDGQADTIFKHRLRQPAQLVVDLGRIDGIAHIVSFSVLHMLDQTLRLAKIFTDEFHDIDIFHLVVSADVVDFSDGSVAQDQINRLTVILDIQPVAHIESLSVYRKWLVLSQTTDSLSVRNNPVAYLRTNFSKPYVSMRYKAKNKGDVDKISQSLQKILMEDQTLRVVNDSENRQTLLYGMGEQQLEIVQSMLLEKYKVEIELMRPKVAFRETIRGKSDVEYKYKKQSGGHGQYGHVKMKFEPSGDLEVPYVFEQCVVGGAVPKNYFPAVEKGIAEAVLKGPLAAYPVIGVKAVLYDGSYHPVDSSEMAFKVAAKQAFKKGFLDAKPVLLEPIASVKIITPEEYTGEIMGDLNKRRGRVMNMNAENGYQEIDADLPYLELYGYNTQLRSMTSGSGTFSYEFARYEQAPEDVAAREIEERAGKVVETEE